MTVVTGPDGGFGYASASACDLGTIDARAIGTKAAGLAERSRNPVGMEPGEYECILMPNAVADMVGMMAYMGFGALSYQENRSFMSGKLGQKIVSEDINIWDNGLDPRTFVAVYDTEGVAKQCVDLIKSGVATGLLLRFLHSAPRRQKVYRTRLRGRARDIRQRSESYSRPGKRPRRRHDLEHKAWAFGDAVPLHQCCASHDRDHHRDDARWHVPCRRRADSRAG